MQPTITTHHPPPNYPDVDWRIPLLAGVCGYWLPYRVGLRGGSLGDWLAGIGVLTSVHGRWLTCTVAGLRIRSQAGL
jgi:hypothetical protein